MSTELSNNSGLNFLDPDSFVNAQRVANMFIYSELVPETYRATPKKGETPDQAKNRATANVILALNISSRIGTDLIMTMQNLFPIAGRVMWSSKFLIATINTCGRFEPLKYRFVDKGKVGKLTLKSKSWDDTKKRMVDKTEVFDGSDIDNIVCVAYTSERGSKDVLESTEVSVEMAINEGWWQRNPKWQTMTKQMLMYRGASFWTSAYAPEISLGFEASEEDTAEKAQNYIEHEEIASTPITPAANSRPIDIKEDAPAAEEVKPEDDKTKPTGDDKSKKADKKEVVAEVKPEENAKHGEANQAGGAGTSLFNDDPYATGK